MEEKVINQLTQKKMKQLGELTATLMLTISEIFITLLLAKIILSIAKLYNIEFVLDFNYIQIFGIICLISLLKFVYKERKTKDLNDTLKLSVNILAIRTTYYLISWGLAVLAHYFI